MSSVPADTAAWAALAVSVLGVLPRIIGVLTRSRSAARRSDRARFETLYDTQDRLISRLESRCDELERHLGRLGAESELRRQTVSKTIR